MGEGHREKVGVAARSDLPCGGEAETSPAAQAEGTPWSIRLGSTTKGSSIPCFRAAIPDMSVRINQSIGTPVVWWASSMKGLYSMKSAATTSLWMATARTNCIAWKAVRPSGS